MKLYQYKVSEGFGPELINDNINSTMPIRLTPTHTHASILLLKQGRPI